MLKDLYTLGQEKQAVLEKSLLACQDVKGAQDVAARWLDEVCSDYASDCQDNARVKTLFHLLGIAKSGLEAMGAVSKTEIRRYGAPLAKPEKRSPVALLVYVPAVLCASASLWALLEEKMGVFALCLIAAAVSLVLANRPAAPVQAQERVEATAQVDVQQMIRRCQYLLRDLDGELAQVEETKASACDLPRDLLESTQMLMEAQLTSDADYALKSISSLAGALEKQGVQFVPYCDESASDFDLLPAPVGGKTIRPALRKGEALLLRGQATVKI